EHRVVRQRRSQPRDLVLAVLLERFLYERKQVFKLEVHRPSPAPATSVQMFHSLLEPLTPPRPESAQPESRPGSARAGRAAGTPERSAAGRTGSRRCQR